MRLLSFHQDARQHLMADPLYGPRTHRFVVKAGSDFEDWVHDKNAAGFVHATPKEAIDNCRAGDVINVYPGDYDTDTAVAVLSENDVVIRGLQGPRETMRVLWRGTGGDDHHVLDIEATGVEVCNMGFIPGAESAVGNVGGDVDHTQACIRVSAQCLGNYHKAWIHHNLFYAAFNTTGMGVHLGERGCSSGGKGDAFDSVIEHNLFHALGCGIHCDGTRTTIRNNRFLVTDVTCAGINYIPNGGERPDSWILDNYFINNPNQAGPATPYGIYFQGTPTDGRLMIAGNQFCNFSDATHCTNIASASLLGLSGINWWGVTVLPAT